MYRLGMAVVAGILLAYVAFPYMVPTITFSSVFSGEAKQSEGTLQRDMMFVFVIGSILFWFLAGLGQKPKQDLQAL